ncbi:MAG TPA: zinc ribbon domain-containing protein [Candidatus Cryosericum sp.]|nr:zinc ribbon domain-containing protein [Candidatus Cryosericum sp.]
MAFCSNCGAPIPEGQSRFCPTCGAAQTQPAASPVVNQKTRGGSAPVFVQAPAGLNKSEFYKSYSPGAKKCVGAGILGYICAGITAGIAVSGIVETIGITALLDAGITLTLSLLIHLLKSRVAATLLLVYAVVSIIIMLATTGQFSGWLIALAAIWGMNGAFAANKEWQMYQLRNRNADAANTGAPTAL